MNKEHQHIIGNLATGLFLVVIFFLITEFTNKNSAFIPFFASLTSNPFFFFKEPHCIEVWRDGNITGVGFFVLIVFLLAFGTFIYHLFKQNSCKPNAEEFAFMLRCSR